MPYEREDGKMLMGDDNKLKLDDELIECCLSTGLGSREYWKISFYLIK